MSFMEILQKAREEAKQEIRLSKTMPCLSSPAIIEELGNNIPETEEVLTEDNQIPLGDMIIKQSADAVYKYKKLRLGSNKSKRIAKAIADNKISSSQLMKAIKIQERYNPKRPDWHIVGGHALQQLRVLLERGVNVQVAINTPYKDLENE